MNAITDPAGFGLADIESVLFDLRAATAMLGHMASSDDTVEEEHLHFIENNLIDCHRKLEAAWQQAWEDMKAERERYRGEVAKAKAEALEAAPGSIKQIKRAEAMLSFLRAGTSAMAERVGEMEEQIAAALAEREADA